jgi:hypothetical protein
VWLWPPVEPDVPGVAEPVVPLDELEDEESLLELEEEEELPAALDVLEPACADALAVPAARAAIEPASPRNVAALSTAATTRERFAACRRRRMAGRRVVTRPVFAAGAPSAGGEPPSSPDPRAEFMPSPRGVESTRRTLDHGHEPEVQLT